MDILEKNFHDKDLLKLLDKIPQLIEGQNFYENIKYLGHIKDINKHDDFLY